MIKVFDSEEAWLIHKIELFSGSEINRLLAPGKRPMTNEELKKQKEDNPKSAAKFIEDPSILSEGAKTYIFEKFCEGAASDIYPDYQNMDMQHGKDNEKVLFDELDSKLPFVEIQRYGSMQYVFVHYDENSGCSPDGVCLGKFVVEGKSPTSKKIHMQRVMYVHNGPSLKEHDQDIYAQIQFAMMSMKLPLGLFVSHYDGVRNPEHRLHCAWIEEDKPFQELIKAKLQAAVKEKQRLVEEYKSKQPRPLTI